MKAAVLFQDLGRLDDFQSIGYGGHFVFQNEAKIFHSQNFAGHDFLRAAFTF